MIVYTLSMVVTVFVSAEAAKPRSVNVALETVFEFENTSDIDFLNNIQNFISKVKDIIEENPDPSNPSRRKQRYKFTDFLENLIINLNTFNDNVLEEVIRTIDSEIRKGEHTDALQINIRELLLNKLDGVNIKSAKSIRKHFDNLLKKLKSSVSDKDNYFLGFIDTLYKKDSERKLTNFIRKLKILRRGHRRSKDLQNTIRKAVQQIVFDHFSKLSDDTKIMVGSQIKDYLNNNYLRDNINKNSLEYKRDNVKTKLTKSQNNVGKTILRHELVKRKEKIINIPKVYNVIKSIKRKRINKTLVRDTIGVKTNTRIKSSHITLYPEILDKRKMAYFRATNLVPPHSGKPKDATDSHKYEAIEPYHSIKQKGAKYENIPEDVLPLSSISQRAEINVNFISSNGDESNDLYSPIKIRAASYETKNQRTTKSNKSFKFDLKRCKTKTEEFYSTPETSVEHFGSLYKSKAPKISTERSPFDYIANKLKLTRQNKETLKDKSDENKIYKKIYKRPTINTENTERNLPDKQLTVTEAKSEKHNSKLGWYRRAHSFNESKDANIININNNKIDIRKINKKTVARNVNFNISKLLEWYRRAKADGLKQYENITENINFQVTERNRSLKNITATEATSKNVNITKSDFYRRVNELNRLKEETIKLLTKFENKTSANNTKNNLYNYETMTEKMQYTISKRVSNFTESDIANEILTNVTEFKRDEKENYRTSVFDVTKNTQANISKRDKIYLDSTSQNVTFETKTTNQVNSSFDIKSFIKNSDIRNIEDEQKRKEIERKMKQDLDKLFASPITNVTTTEAYTDIFEALDDAFDLSPLK